jgi:phosphatidylinositol-3,4,5-trisphosphate 3-phosphatase/dual-specificity protein phosphatase PTEN
LTYFAKVRTADGKGVTIPSQRRYVRYWDMMMQHFQGKEPLLRPVQLQQIRIESSIKLSGTIEVYFTLEENQRERIDSRKLFPTGGRREADGSLVFAFRDPLPTLTGDLRFIFYQRNALLADEELFHFWLNTGLCQANERLTKADFALDGRPSKSKEIIFCPSLAAEVQFFGTYARPNATGTPLTATACASSGSFLAAPAADAEKESIAVGREKGFFKKFFATP